MVSKKKQLSAARAAEEAGDFKRAIELYVEGGFFWNAADLAEAAGMSDTAQELYNNGIDVYENRGTCYGFWYAARCAEKTGQLERAVRNYEKGEFFVRAAKLAEKAGMVEKAIEILISSQSVTDSTQTEVHPILRAERLSEQAGLPKLPDSLIERVIAEFEGKDDFWRAALLAERIGMTDRAISNYGKAGAFEFAARLANQQGNRARAGLFYETAIKAVGGGGLYAARLAEEAGFREQAIQMHIKAGDVLSAARIARDVGMTCSAILYLRIGRDFLRAADVAEAAGMSDLAKEYREKHSTISLRNQKEQEAK